MSHLQIAQNNNGLNFSYCCHLLALTVDFIYHNLRLALQRLSEINRGVMNLPFCLVHPALNIFSCIFQLGVDIGSSTVARGVVSLVLGYLNNLVIEMAFLVQVIVAYLIK